MDRREDSAAHAIVGFAGDFSYSPALDYVAVLVVPSRSDSSVRAPSASSTPCGPGSASKAIHDFIAGRHPELVRVLPGSGASRSYCLVEYEDTRGIGRIRAIHDFLADAVEHDRADFARPH